MKCPVCGSDLIPQMHHGIDVQYCPQDQGIWLAYQELDQLEDEVFKADDEKGSLMLTSAPSERRCPVCNGPLRQFQYRMDNLTLDFCEKKDGFWLDSGEEDRVLQLMKARAKQMKSKFDAEKEWGKTLRHLQSPSFFDKLSGLFK